jgi:hypothetical protein
VLEGAVRIGCQLENIRQRGAADRVGVVDHGARAGLAFGRFGLHQAQTGERSIESLREADGARRLIYRGFDRILAGAHDLLHQRGLLRIEWLRRHLGLLLPDVGGLADRRAERRQLLSKAPRFGPAARSQRCSDCRGRAGKCKAARQAHLETPAGIGAADVARGADTTVGGFARVLALRRRAGGRYIWWYKRRYGHEQRLWLRRRRARNGLLIEP